MAAESSPTAPTSQDALATLLRDVLPAQGAWSDEAYLWLTDHTNRPIEFSDGWVQELPKPTSIHQLVLGNLGILDCGPARCDDHRAVRIPGSSALFKACDNGRS